MYIDGNLICEFEYNQNVPIDIAIRIYEADGSEKVDLKIAAMPPNSTRPVGETRLYWYSDALQYREL